MQRIILVPMKLQPLTGGWGRKAGIEQLLTMYSVATRQFRTENGYKKDTGYKKEEREYMGRATRPAVPPRGVSARLKRVPWFPRLGSSRRSAPAPVQGTGWIQPQQHQLGLGVLPRWRTPGNGFTCRAPGTALEPPLPTQAGRPRKGDGRSGRQGLTTALPVRSTAGLFSGRNVCPPPAGERTEVYTNRPCAVRKSCVTRSSPVPSSVPLSTAERARACGKRLLR